MKKLIRITTVPISLSMLLSGQLSYFKKYFEIIAVSSPGNILNKVESEAKVRTLSLNLTRAITPLKDIISLIKFTFFLIEEKPLIVHSHTPKAGIVSMLAAFLARVPIRMHTVAGLPLMEAKGFKKKVLIFVEKLTYATATNVYPNSFGLKDYIIKNKFCSESKVKVIGSGSSNGIDTDYFSVSNMNSDVLRQIKESIGIEKDTFVFCFVGRIVRDKGIHELVSAFNRIEQKEFKSKLLLVGNYEQELDPIDLKILNKIKANNNIIEVGYQEDVRSYMGISNALLLPSYREGFPNVVLQAGAMNLPAIVSNINGCNEIITHHENGLIVPVKEVTPLYESMILLMKNPSLCNSLSLNSRERIKSKYERSHFWNLLLKEYKLLESNVYNNKGFIR